MSFLRLRIKKFSKIRMFSKVGYSLTYWKNNNEYCSKCDNEIIDFAYCKPCQYKANNINVQDACGACDIDIERGDSELIYHPVLSKLVRVHHACHLAFIGDGHALHRH